MSAFPTASPASEKPAPRPFLSLPDVIRERICYFVLVVKVDPVSPWITPLPLFQHKSTLFPDAGSDLKSVESEHQRAEAVQATVRAAPDSSLAILATCRTILLESFHLWYKYNLLNFSSAKDLCEFLYSVSRARANEIRSIRLDLPEEDFNHGKCAFALSRLLALENLTFVWNDYKPYWLLNASLMPYPKAISNLRGLRTVTFVDPVNPKPNAIGQEQGMVDSVKKRMHGLGVKMMTKRKHPKALPPMMDLFSRLKTEDQTKKDRALWNWQEKTAYAPEMNAESQLVATSFGEEEEDVKPVDYAAPSSNVGSGTTDAN
ncbi:MAG: hypothetical protein Q9220_005332 [cf. Caloplaca sp. 1 TL-2023]